MNQKLFISISVSLAIHILLLAIFKLTETGVGFSNKKSSSVLNVLIEKTDVSETRNLQASKSSDSINDVALSEPHRYRFQEKLQVDQSDQILNREPKYYSLKELDNRPLMVTDINTKPAELEQFNEGGEIKVQIWIDEGGNVIKSEIINSNLPQVFIDYTLASFNQAKFLPGIKDGVPVRAVAKVVVQYAAIE